ncbi:DNA-binding protein [Bacteroidia bacterium]|nr:DNA-binding protein [Bacteroidia bacterium]
MEILDNKSNKITSFFTALDEMLDTIGQALKNRTPHLNGEKYLTNKDVCRMLHISSRTLQDWRDTGKIPFIRIKGKILYQESEVLKWLEQNYFESGKTEYKA